MREINCKFEEENKKNILYIYVYIICMNLRIVLAKCSQKTEQFVIRMSERKKKGKRKEKTFKDSFELDQRFR